MAGPDFAELGLVPYDEAWAEQRRRHAARAEGTAPDTVLLLEHPPVYTAGKRTAPGDRPQDGTPVVDVDRGGKITWHGPGQLVGYPIVRLPDPVDVVSHVRRVEEALILTCADLGVETTRVEGRSGVWVLGTDGGQDRKVAAIGVRVSQGVTMHGFALNCDCDLTLVRPHRAVRPAGRDGDLAVARDRARRDRGRGAAVRPQAPHRGPAPPLTPRPRRRTAPQPGGRATYPGEVTIAPEGRKLLRLEVRNSETPIERKPPWIKTRATMGPEYTELKSLVKREGLHTVCEEAGCPNIFECWEDREATFLIGGDQCTRRCDFCQIDTGKPDPLDRDEPRRVAESVQAMGLRYATITGVARDDLPDGGAWLYAETVKQIHALNPGTGVENLIPDFNGNPDQLAEVFDSRPEVLAHNLETVPRIFKRIRPAFRYDRSLDVLTQARAAGLVTKSNLILGMGEERTEVSQALRDLHAAGCELHHDHAVPPAVAAPPPGDPVGQARGVRRDAGRGRGDRLRRCHVRPARPLVLPRRPPLPAGRRGAGDGRDRLTSIRRVTRFSRRTSAGNPAGPAWRHDTSSHHVAGDGDVLGDRPHRRPSGHPPGR